MIMNAAQINRRGGPAFPTPKETATLGMSLGDYFAGQAMAALLRGDPSPKALTTEGKTKRAIAKEAYEYADAMLEERMASAPPSKG